MIFEETDPLNPNPVSKKKLKTKDDWIVIGVEYLTKKEAGWTQRRFALETKIPVSTLQKAFRKFRDEILAAYGTKKKDKRNVPVQVDRKRSLINSFRGQLKTYAQDKNISANNKSVKWFREKVKQSVKGKSVTAFKPGAIYTYVYDAKHKDTLPYWDKYPLIISLGTSTTKHGVKLMHGLNLHYIPPRARQEFLESLLIYATTKKQVSISTRLKINWDTVKGMRGSKHMIKAYLPQNIRGKIVEVDPREWVNVIYLPTQQFYSKGKRFGANKVWSNANV